MSFRINEMKLIWDDIVPERSHVLALTEQDLPLLPSLFNLTADPFETTNIASLHPELVLSMTERIVEIANTAVPIDAPPENEAGNPSNFGGFWSTGWC